MRKKDTVKLSCEMRPETAQQIGTLGAFAGDLSLVPSAHTGWLTTACNTSSRAFNALSWAPWIPTLTHTQTQRNT